jgi:hypothetical protein
VIVLLGVAYAAAMWAIWRRKDRCELLLLKGTAMGMILAATIKTALWTQFHFWAVPFVILLAALELRDRGMRRPLRPVVGAVFVVAAAFWFCATWRHHTKIDPPDLWNAPFVALMLLGTVLVVPGWLGRGLGLIIAACFLYSLGAIDWRPYLSGARDYRLSRALNGLLAVVLYYGGAVILVVHLLRRPGEAREQSRPFPTGGAPAGGVMVSHSRAQEVRVTNRAPNCVSRPQA